MANMAIEAGAKNGIFPVDEKTKAYLAEHCKKEYTVYEADEDAVYDEVIEIDLSKYARQLLSHIFREMQRQLMKLRQWNQLRLIRL